jgi:hypothetical protein
MDVNLLELKDKEEFYCLLKKYLKDENFDRMCDALLRCPKLGRLEHQPSNVAKEARGIIEAMQSFIEALTAAVCPNAVQVVIRGSMAEGTRCGPPDEFDFLLISQKKNLSQDISERILQNAEIFHTSPFDFVSSGFLGKTVKLEVLFCGDMYKNLVISIDLVPVTVSNDQSVYGSHNWSKHVIFKGCQLYEYGEEVSFSDYEQKLMLHLPAAAIDAYVILKALRSPIVHGKIFADIGEKRQGLRGLDWSKTDLKTTRHTPSSRSCSHFMEIIWRNRLMCTPFHENNG